MANASVNKFETTVLSALQLAQGELISAGMESSQTNEAFRELKMCLSSVSKRHFGGVLQKHKHMLLAAFPLLTSISKRWYKTLMRRMIPRCGVKNPWRVIVSENLSRDLFGLVQQIATRSSCRVTTHSTTKRITMVFTRETKVRHLFCEIMDCKIKEEKFLKRSASGIKKVQAIINEERNLVCLLIVQLRRSHLSSFMEYGMNMAGLDIFRTHRKHNYSNNFFQ